MICNPDKLSCFLLYLQLKDAKLTILPLASIWIPLTKLSLGEVCELDLDAMFSLG